MSEIAERYRTLAAGLTERAQGVPEGGWDRPAPCEGWVARDVVRHLVEWMPAMFLSGPGLTAPDGPSVDDDPAGAWAALDRALQAALDDPATARSELVMQMGTFALEDAFGMFGMPDVLVHTWDLARATGQDERLDPAEVHRTLDAMSQVDDEMLRGSGHFGPRVEVPEDADEVTRLIAFTGRTP